MQKSYRNTMKSIISKFKNLNGLYKDHSEISLESENENFLAPNFEIFKNDDFLKSSEFQDTSLIFINNESSFLDLNTEALN